MRRHNHWPKAALAAALVFRPAFAPAQPMDVLHYRLSLALAMSNADLRGVMEITLVLRSPADRVTLNEARLQLDSVTADGGAAPFSVDSTAEEFTVNLPSQRNTGDTVQLRIVYHRDPLVSRPSSRQGYYFFPDTINIPANLGYTMSEPSDARFWMPCRDDPSEKASAQISVSVPPGYVAASNGRLDSVTSAPGGGSVWHWREDHPIASYLMCVTASRFAVPSLPYLRSTGDTVPVQYYVWAEDSLQAAGYLPTVRNMIAAYADLFGPYPFDKYGMAGVVPFAYGGMEHQSMTTLNRFVETDERVVSHELAHQWWGDLVTCGTWSDIWLNESFATYSEALWAEHSGGTRALRSYMTGALEHFERGSWTGAVYDPLGQGFNLFDDVVYSKGAWVLHMLRGVLGDSVFFDALHRYRASFAGKSALTADFQNAVEAAAGRSLDWFFREWIYGDGWPTYEFSYSWQGDLLSCTLRQRQGPSWQAFKMPLTLRAYHHVGGATSFLVWDSLRTQSFTLPLPYVPDSVALDPDHWVLRQSVPGPAPTGQITLSFRVQQNYPNPFNPRTRIQYSIPDRRNVTVAVYDILGRKVALLVQENKPPGEYVVDFDGSHLASGTYFVRVQAGGETIEKKMMLVK